MPKPVSEQLADLSKRAKQAEDSVASAKSKASEKVHQREEEIQAAAAERKATVRTEFSDAQSGVGAAWAGITNKVQSDVDTIRARIDTRKYEHDRDRARKAADDAEESASLAINFAFDAIDYAEYLVLDSVLARETAASF